MTAAIKSTFTEKNIPFELKQYRQWVLWRYETRDGNQTKIPYQTNGEMASTTDASTWNTYDAVIKAYSAGDFAGIGFVVTATDKFCGIDMDHCRDAKTGVIDPSKMVYIKLLNSYTEITPSMTGVRVWVKASLPKGDKIQKRNDKKHIEIYDSLRFFTVTGNHLDETPTIIQKRQEQLNQLHASIFPPTPKENKGNGHRSHADVDDTELLQKAMAARNGASFTSLWNGDTSEYDGDDSRADLALCSMLAFWTGNEEGCIDKLFRQSGLYREKWERQDYRERTILKAIQDNHKSYKPGFTTKNQVNKNNSDTNIIITELPEIRVTGRNTKDITADAIDALNKSNNPPIMFMRGSLPVRVSKDECDTPYIEVMNEPALRGRLDRVATYVKYVKNQGKQEGDEYKAVPTAVPLDVVRDVMSLPDFRLPALINITEIPTLRADGSILATPGYDLASKLYYAPSRNLIVPKISESPTAKEIREAVNLINEVYINFPFDSQASRANAIAATATCIYRPMFDGNVPLFIISKPQAGVGAGLMTAAICMTTTGRDPAMFGAPKDEDEWAKVIFAAVKAGQQIIIFDNCDGVLYSANLARLITARTIGGRILGRSENAVMPNNSMIFCNGNNITLDGDLPRRSYLSRMETDADMPWERECNYLHSPLIPWVKANQGRIVAAYLTIAKAWIAAGKPLDDSLPRLGSFEEWQTVIGGVLKNAAIEGFLGNRETVYRISDTGSQQWETFTEALTSVFPEDFTVADIANLIFPKKDTEITSQGSDLKNALPDLIDKDLRQFSTSLGRALNKKLNVKWHNGWVITKPEGVKPRHHAVVWKIINWRENSAQTTTGEVTSPPPVSQGRLGEDKPLPTHYKTDNNNSYIETGVVTSPTSPLGTKKGEVTQKAPGKLEKLGKCPVCGKEDTEGMWTDDSPEGYYFYCTNCFVTFVPTTEWTEVPDDAFCPSGDYEYRLELGGKKYGRIHPANNDEPNF